MTREEIIITVIFVLSAFIFLYLLYLKVQYALDLEKYNGHESEEYDEYSVDYTEDGTDDK